MSIIPWRNKRRNESMTDIAPAAFTQLRQEMERVVERFFRDPFGMFDFRNGVSDRWAPAIDLTETPEEITVRAEIPGVQAKDLDVSITDDVLTITGEKRETHERKSAGFVHSETRYGSFQRRIRLPAEVDADNVSAEVVDGVLTMRLKKAPGSRPKRIAVTSKG
ncbi:MAG: Hsp20/alpha crystallin family protein [Phycisphaerae bacterium]|nr:Hsp20/alpha crystallin family protein [Phycisphaerae bacterium]